MHVCVCTCMCSTLIFLPVAIVWGKRDKNKGWVRRAAFHSVYRSSHQRENLWFSHLARSIWEKVYGGSVNMCSLLCSWWPWHTAQSTEDGWEWICLMAHPYSYHISESHLWYWIAIQSAQHVWREKCKWGNRQETHSQHSYSHFNLQHFTWAACVCGASDEKSDKSQKNHWWHLVIWLFDVFRNIKCFAHTHHMYSYTDMEETRFQIKLPVTLRSRNYFLNGTMILKMTWQEIKDYFT